MNTEALSLKPSIAPWSHDQDPPLNLSVALNLFNIIVVLISSMC
jgi:hypothetical protein